MKPLLAIVILLRACNPAAPTAPKPIVVHISPDAAEVYADGQVTFHATVENSADQRVTWKLVNDHGERCEPTCGTLTVNPDGTAIFTPSGGQWK